MPTLQNKRLVYVVDNDDAVRDSLRALLESAGLKAAVFGSGEEFLNVAETLSNGCVLLDIHLPKRDGFEVLEALAACRRDMPVVLITSHRHLAERARENAVGAVAVLEKPVNDQALLPIIERALSDIAATGSRDPQATGGSRHPCGGCGAAAVNDTPESR